MGLDVRIPWCPLDLRVAVLDAQTPPYPGAGRVRVVAQLRAGGDLYEADTYIESHLLGRWLDYAVEEVVQNVMRLVSEQLTEKLKDDILQGIVDHRWTV